MNYAEIKKQILLTERESEYLYSFPAAHIVAGAALMRKHGILIMVYLLQRIHAVK